MSDVEKMTELRTPAWLMIGMTGSAPGVLELAGGRIAFTGEEGRAFEAAVGDVTAKFPWYYFGGGCKLAAGGQAIRVSFVRPNGGADVPGQLLARTAGEGLGAVAGGAAALLTAGRKVRDIGEGRKAGKAWRAALAGRG
ncbi:MAG TPA: hypothetical protein VEA69_12790 [Tepidisphaeraceae bacterium]|nr:hypothetical protein [Tepidisphaeraceae bacterium]